MQAPVLLVVAVLVSKLTLQDVVEPLAPIICGALELSRTLIVNFFVPHASAIPVTVIDSRLNIPEVRTVDGTTVMPSLSQEIVVVDPWPNSTLLPDNDSRMNLRIKPEQP